MTCGVIYLHTEYVSDVVSILKEMCRCICLGIMSSVCWTPQLLHCVNYWLHHLEGMANNQLLCIKFNITKKNIVNKVLNKNMEVQKWIKRKYPWCEKKKQVYKKMKITFVSLSSASKHLNNFLWCFHVPIYLSVKSQKEPHVSSLHLGPRLNIAG